MTQKMSPLRCGMIEDMTSLGQMKVMSAIERCRTSVLGGHVARCDNDKCGHIHIAYNSCRNRHCPKGQGGAALKWLEAREAELLNVPYDHVVFTLPGEIADIADKKHLGAKAGITSVLHTWGSAMSCRPVHAVADAW